jgi:hypothetical protein
MTKVKMSNGRILTLNIGHHIRRVEQNQTKGIQIANKIRSNQRNKMKVVQVLFV